jgi:HSP20 family protein
MFGMIPFNRRNNDLIGRNNPFDLNNFFDDFFSDSFMPAFFAPTYAIKADVRETDKEYIIEADMPGVKKDEIMLDLRDGVLTIGVEHNEQKDERNDNYIRKERRYGSYCRSFRVDGIDQEKVSAKYNDGVLTITLPKQEEARSKSYRINIQ